MLAPLLAVLLGVVQCQAIDHCLGNWDCSLNGACAGVIGSRSCLCTPPVMNKRRDWSGLDMVGVGHV